MGLKKVLEGREKCYAREMKKIILVLEMLTVFLPVTVFAATTAETSSEILLPHRMVQDQNDKGKSDFLYQVNQKVCSRFEEDVVKLSAIMEELRRRKGITETRVAFGGVDTPIKNADYWVTYAAEAVAYQQAQKYSSKSELRNSLEVLKNKILQAKGEVGKVLND